MKLLLINGPNLNMLGVREPEKYGNITLEDIEISLKSMAEKEGIELDCYQSNHEGDIIEKIQKSKGEYSSYELQQSEFVQTI